MSNVVRYSDGQAVLLGDIVDVGHGNGPKVRVVVIIPTGLAVSGFVSSEWSYLNEGVLLQDQTLFGLLHISELTDEHVLVSRA